MAKADKPAHVLQHSGPAVKVSPNQPQNSKSKKRKRIARGDGESMTQDTWRVVIESIANGGTRKDAAKAAGVSPQTIDAYLITNVAAYKQIRDAILLWNRRDWPTELIEQILDDLAMGMTLASAARKNGVPADKGKMSSLYRLMRKDAALREAYDEARELQAESFLDEIIDIADNTENDWQENGKANHEVVNRSRLRIDTRRFTMGAVVKRRFGDHKHVDVEGNIFVNHIGLLTNARKRIEKVKPALIDNETGNIATTPV